MGKIRYTVTTRTTSCPHCGHVLDEETHGELTPIISCLWFITFPIFLHISVCIELYTLKLLQREKWSTSNWFLQKSKP